jgi:hypothetical protein
MIERPEVEDPSLGHERRRGNGGEDKFLLSWGRHRRYQTPLRTPHSLSTAAPSSLAHLWRRMMTKSHGVYVGTSEQHPGPTCGMTRSNKYQRGPPADTIPTTSPSWCPTRIFLA